MGLFDMLSSGKVMNKKAKLEKDIVLDDGESRKKGDIVSVLIANKDGTYHVEDNEFSCTLKKGEFTLI